MTTNIPLLNGANKNRPSQTAQVVVYGWTPSGCIAAIEAKRNGATVLLVGGWRDWNIGGVACGGLCHQDYVNLSLSTGLAQTFWSAASGTSVPYFTSWQATAALQGMLTNAGITPIRTQGVTQVFKDGLAITSFVTQDGQQFFGNYFIDASYEADLMALSGVSYNVGQDAKNSTTDPSDGYGAQLSDVADGFSYGNKFLGISPYVTAGVSSSGLLPTMSPKPYPATGAQANSQMAFCYRMNLRKYAVGGTPDAHWVALPSTPPVGYNAQNYELILRWIAAVTATGATYTVDNGGTFNNSYFFLAGIQGGNTGSSINNTGVFDCNQGAGPPLIDILGTGAWNPEGDYLLGGAADYTEASYARRQQIWQAAQSWIMGALYLFQYGTDPRIPATLQQDFLTFGFDSRQFQNPYPGDLAGFPYQLYVRVMRRMVSDFVIHTNDLTATDGTTPRSTKTIAQGCYPTDCHVCNNVINIFKTPDAAVMQGGPPDTSTGGSNQMYPIPYDIIVPAAAQCSNLFCIWAPSASSEAMCSLRIENPMMQMGQAAGCAAAIGCASGYPSVQTISYTALRTQLLAEGMVLPQTN